MLKAFKAWILRDVENKNELPQGAITLRICSLILISYFVFQISLMFFAEDIKLILFNIIFVALYAYVIWLTFCDMTKGALWWFNMTTIGFVCFNVLYLGWDSGIQHFIFTLVLLNLIFTYLSRKMQFMAAAFFCFIRLLLYYYCRIHETSVVISDGADQALQIITTVYVFILLFICGVMLSQDSKEMERKLIEYNNELQQIANTDTLTKLWNRHYLMKYIAGKIKVHSHFMSIAIGDIDFFKKINDTYGHECGDEVLRSLAGVFAKKMEGNGGVARWGGEEFIFVYENANGDEARMKLADLQTAIKDTVISYNDQNVKVTMTFGLVEFDYGLSLDENICIADQRLYQGKISGRDRIVY